MTAEFPQYDPVAQRLIASESAMDPAEVHGRLCGYLCAAHKPDYKQWLSDVLLQLKAELPELEQLLRQLWEATLGQLEGEGFELQLLVAPLDGPLAERVDALASFCSGFLAGLSTGGFRGVFFGSDEKSSLQEFVEDLREISRATVDDSESSDDSDFDYVELVEYVRAGVQLCWEEIRLLRGAGSVH